MMQWRQKRKNFAKLYKEKSSSQRQRRINTDNINVLTIKIMFGKRPRQFPRGVSMDAFYYYLYLMNGWITDRDNLLTTQQIIPTSKRTVFVFCAGLFNGFNVIKQIFQSVAWIVSHSYIKKQVYVIKNLYEFAKIPINNSKLMTSLPFEPTLRLLLKIHVKFLIYD